MKRWVIWWELSQILIALAVGGPLTARCMGAVFACRNDTACKAQVFRDIGPRVKGEVDAMFQPRL